MNDILLKKYSFAYPAGGEKKFPPIETIKFPIYALLYQLDDNALVSQTYKVKLTNSLFTGNNKSRLLFHEDDLRALRYNNDIALIDNLNRVLNSLSEQLKKRGITLISLPCPDKYDLYHDFMVDHKRYPRPLFFDLMEPLSKKYIYVDSKALFRSQVSVQPDIYFYDDTHWSPVGASMIAKKIMELIRQDTE